MNENKYLSAIIRCAFCGIEEPRPDWYDCLLFTCDTCMDERGYIYKAEVEEITSDKENN